MFSFEIIGLMLIIVIGGLFIRNDFIKKINQAKLIMTEKERQVEELQSEIKLLESKKSEEIKLFALEKDKKIEELQSKIEKSHIGLIANWLPALESESAIKIRIYNDSSRKIYNLKILIPKKYKDTCEVFSLQDTLDPSGQVEAYFFPFRQQFALRWYRDELNPIALQIQYTETPQMKDFKYYDLILDTSKVSNHFRQIIERISELNEEEINNIIYLEKTYKNSPLE